MEGGAIGMVKAGTRDGAGVFVDPGVVVAVAPVVTLCGTSRPAGIGAAIYFKDANGTVAPFLYCSESSDEVERALRGEAGEAEANPPATSGCVPVPAPDTRAVARRLEDGEEVEFRRTDGNWFCGVLPPTVFARVASEFSNAGGRFTVGSKQVYAGMIASSPGALAYHPQLLTKPFLSGESAARALGIALSGFGYEAAR